MNLIQKSQWLVTLVLVALVTMLSACSGQQVRQPPADPLVCPEIDFELPERQKPLAAMGTAISFPQVPTGFELWEGEQQARWVVENWVRSAEAYATCESKRKTLIDWIEQ